MELCRVIERRQPLPLGSLPNAGKPTAVQLNLGLCQNTDTGDSFQKPDALTSFTTIMITNGVLFVYVKH